MAINRTTFFNHVRTVNKKLKQGQVSGFTFILDAWEASELTDKRWLAYALATAWHETNQTMQPVIEAYWLSEDWRKKHLRYYPYYGRGYVQLTWKENYEKYGIADTPEKALDPSTAARIMFKGMTEGTFTGHKLNTYFNTTTDDPYHARMIINGLDRARDVAVYYRVFKKALEV